MSRTPKNVRRLPGAPTNRLSVRSCGGRVNSGRAMRQRYAQQTRPPSLITAAQPNSTSVSLLSPAVRCRQVPTGHAERAPHAHLNLATDTGWAGRPADKTGAKSTIRDGHHSHRGGQRASFGHQEFSSTEGGPDAQSLGFHGCCGWACDAVGRPLDVEPVRKGGITFLNSLVNLGPPRQPPYRGSEPRWTPPAGFSSVELLLGP
jgi:hypothetical protein